jgi:hypothetical protein
MEKARLLLELTKKREEAKRELVQNIANVLDAFLSLPNEKMEATLPTDFLSFSSYGAGIENAELAMLSVTQPLSALFQNYPINNHNTPSPQMKRKRLFESLDEEEMIHLNSTRRNSNKDDESEFKRRKQRPQSVKPGRTPNYVPPGNY